MDDYPTLVFRPAGRPPFTVDLYPEGVESPSRGPSSFLHAGTAVFSDLNYDFILNYRGPEDLEDVQFYVNDIFEPSIFSEGKIRFSESGPSGKWIFRDCYGFAEVSLVLETPDGRERKYHTPPLPVLVRSGQLNQAVKAMVRYVYAHQELLFEKDAGMSFAFSSREGRSSLESRIALAEEIAEVYERNYGYFKANSRFRIEKVPTVDHLEKLQVITPLTLSYVVSHPEQLEAVNSPYGIHYGNQVYQPRKVMFLKDTCSRDIYENRVVLGFLERITREMRKLRETCRNLTTQFPEREYYSSEYLYSSYFIFEETREKMEQSIDKLNALYEKFVKLWGMYQSALPVEPEIPSGKPRLSPIFLSVPQYQSIHVRMCQWLDQGMYDFSKEQYLLSFIKISSLYEDYLLSRMVSYFLDREYTLVEAHACRYPPVSANWKYRNTPCLNTFLFSDGKREITLYYQPVIYDQDQSSVNGITLYRNNSLSVYITDHEDEAAGGHYYTPDYLIQVTENGRKKYLVMDAKFSDINSVKKYHVRDLAFKYLFSLSPLDSATEIAGLCILYGKCHEDDILQSVYDKEIENSPIRPFFDIFPIMENVDTSDQFRKMDQLLKKLMDSPGETEGGTFMKGEEEDNESAD